MRDISARELKGHNILAVEQNALPVSAAPQLSLFDATE